VEAYSPTRQRGVITQKSEAVKRRQVSLAPVAVSRLPLTILSTPRLRMGLYASTASRLLKPHFQYSMLNLAIVSVSPTSDTSHILTLYQKYSNCLKSTEGHMQSKINLFIFQILFFLPLLLPASDFPYDPPQNFTLSTKYIAVHHPVTTRDITAQLYFDQGLTFLYAFNHDAAFWSFLRAAQTDPNMPMAFWGMALAIGRNINADITIERANKAYEFVKKAALLATNAPQQERDYVSALLQRYKNASQTDSGQLNKNYSLAMQALSKKYPDDLDAAVLTAESILDINPWHQWSVEGKPLEGTQEAVKLIESVLKRDPQNLGANHYYIHAIEASNHPERALMSAERLKTLLPSSGHILHMPSHIYLLVGDYQQAALSNENAIAADREYIREFGIIGNYPVHYLSHEYFFISRAYSMAGRYQDAKNAAEQLSIFYSPYSKTMPGLEYYFSCPMFVLLRFHKWTEILSLPQPDSELLVSNVLWHFGRSAAFAYLGNKTQATEEQKQFLEGKAKLPSSAIYGYNTAATILSIAEVSLAAHLAIAGGELPKAIQFLEQAIKIQNSLNYNEPPDWYFPIRESLGGALLKLGQFSQAEEVFRKELEIHPLNGRALFGLQESLLAQSKTYDVIWVQKAFQKAWMYSDIDLTVDQL